MKVSLTLGPNTFDVEGEFILDDGFAAVLRAWINAQQDDGAGERIEQLTERLKAANDAEAATVAANTPTP